MASTEALAALQLSIQKYKGRESAIRVETWLKLFNEEFPEDPAKKLRYFLKDEALEWYGDNVVGTEISSNWPLIQEKMINHFGSTSASPLLDSYRRKLGPNEPLSQYINDKMRLLAKTSLRTKEKIELLTDGLPINWQDLMVAKTFEDLDEWTQCVQKIESNNKQRDVTQPMCGVSSPTGASRLPDTPCKYCKEKLNTDLYHWHRECPNR